MMQLWLWVPHLHRLSQCHVVVVVGLPYCGPAAASEQFRHSVLLSRDMTPGVAVAPVGKEVRNGGRGWREKKEREEGKSGLLQQTQLHKSISKSSIVIRVHTGVHAHSLDLWTIYTTVASSTLLALQCRDEALASYTSPTKRQVPRPWPSKHQSTL